MTAAQLPFQPTSVNHYSHWRAKTVPEVEWLDDLGVVPVPWRGHPIRFTFAYVFASQGEVAVFDPGYDTDEGWEGLVAGLAGGGVAPKNVSLTIVSHFHVDHWGMVDRLRDHSGCDVALGDEESRWYRNLPPEAHSRQRVEHWFRQWGVPESHLADVADTYDFHEPIERHQPERLLVDRDVVTVGGFSLEVRHTPGHTPGQIVLVDHRHKRIFAADHVLPRITPNVSLTPFSSPDPLSDYLASIRQFDDIVDYEAFPGHEYRFVGITERLQQIRAGIEERGAEVASVASRIGVESLWEIAKSLRWYRSWDDFAPISRRMALGETAAFLVHLGLSHPLDFLNG